MALFPLHLVPPKTNVNFIGQKWIAFFFSLALIIASFASVAVKGLNFGIDFTGGIVIEVRFDNQPDLADIRKLLTDESFGEVSLQQFGEQDILIRLQGENGEKGSSAKIVENVKLRLAKNYGEEQIDYRKVDYVGPQVGSELIRAGAIALISAFIAILIYIWARFEWHYGVGAVIALMHDAILTIGFFSILGLEFNLTSIAAILTIIGYSINDSVVIYDRIRENLRKYKKKPMEDLLNLSINDTLSRTLLTAGTTIVALLALVFWGGEVLKGFSLAVLFGVITGTYSSIYVAAPLLDFMNLRGAIAKKEKLAKAITDNP